MEFRIHLLSALIAATAMPSVAQAQDLRPVRLATPMRRPDPPRPQLPEDLAHLPADTEIALYAPDLWALLEDAEAGLRVLRGVLPELEGWTAPGLASEVLWGSGLPSRPSSDASLSPERLAAQGIAPRAPITVVVQPSRRVAVVRIGLVNRPRWERWLDTISGSRRTRIELGGEQASVLFPDSELPLTCLARSHRALCQLGAAPGEDPVAPLRRMVHGDRGRLGDAPGIATAYAHLDAGALATAIVNTPALAPALETFAREREARAHRFARPEARRRALAHAQHLGRKIRHVTAHVTGAALGLSRTDAGLNLQVEASMSARGARHLRATATRRAAHPLVTRWSDTPALLKFVLRADPRLVSALAEPLGFDVPADALTGDVALLALGVDSECPMAKQKRAPRLGWAFLMPTAAAIGLRGPHAADQLHGLVAQRLGRVPDPEAKPRVPLRGHHGGSPYEIAVLDELALVGTGLGSGAAARRRLANAPPAREGDMPMLEAAIDLHAVDAAFAAGAFGAEHRRELLAAEALRLAFKPLLEHVARIEATADPADRGRRLSVQVRTIRPRP